MAGSRNGKNEDRMGVLVKKVQVIKQMARVSANPGRGGWAAILRYGDFTKEMFGFEPHTTNNRMELKAAIEGLRMPQRALRDVEVITDSGIREERHHELDCELEKTQLDNVAEEARGEPRSVGRSSMRRPRRHHIAWSVDQRPRVARKRQQSRG